MRTCHTQLFALALGAALTAPAALADQSSDGDRYDRSGVIIYFGDGGGHIGTDRHWQADRQGYRDGFRGGRRENRHHHRDDRHERRQTHTFVVPPRLQIPATSEPSQPKQANRGGQHVMPSTR